MKVSGLPQEHLELIAQLEAQEKFFLDPEGVGYPPELIAKALTCLAHDWIQIGLEEKGHTLLLKADEFYPGYHKDKMKEDMKNNPIFATLVKSLAFELALVAISTASSNK